MKNEKEQILSDEIYYPFNKEIVPVVHNIFQIQQLLDKFSQHKFCLFISQRDNERWKIARSRRFMNMVLPELIYLPTNVKKLELLFDIYEFSKVNKQIIGINHTSPYKGNKYLQDIFADVQNCPPIIDFIIKDKNNMLIPFNINQISFFEWIENIISLRNKTIIIAGIGRTGKMITKQIANKKPKQLILVDIKDKKDFLSDLKTKSNNIDLSFVNSILDINNVSCNDLIVINSVGQKIIDNDLKTFFNVHQSQLMNKYYFDLTAFTKLEIVEYARNKGWIAESALKMQVLNDYIILEKLANLMDKKCIDINSFERVIRQVNEEINNKN